MATFKGSRDLRSLRVLCNFRLRTLKGTPSVAMLLLLRKKTWGKPGMRRTYVWSGPLPDRVTSGHVTLPHRSKGPTRADMAQLPVAHAENILPDMGTFGHVTDVTSGHVTSGHVSFGSTTAQHHRNCDLSCAHILLHS